MDESNIGPPRQLRLCLNRQKETVDEVKTALQERISERSEAIKVPKISRQRSVEVVSSSPPSGAAFCTARGGAVSRYLSRWIKHVLPERASERISEQGEVIEVPETVSQGRRLQRTVVQYLDVFAEVDQTVLQERISEEDA